MQWRGLTAAPLRFGGQDIRMARFHEAWLERQRKRWMRHDAHRYWRPDAHRWMKPETLRLLGSPVGDQVEGKRAQQLGHDLESDLHARREILLELKAELAAIRAKLRLERVLRDFKAGFNPNQPRVPAGNPEGRQWTDGGGGTGTSEAQATDISGVRRTRGHHFVHQSLYRDLPLRPETRRVFEEATTGPLRGQRHGWSRDHDRYNQGVAEHFERFLQSNGLKPEELTPDQARTFVQEVQSSADPRIRDFNMRIFRQEFQYYLRRIPRGRE
jgi:hypothetical protein